MRFNILSIYSNPNEIMFGAYFMLGVLLLSYGIYRLVHFLTQTFRFEGSLTPKKDILIASLAITLGLAIIILSFR